MGLEEKKVIRDFDERFIPTFIKDFKAVTDSDVAVEIQWDTFQTKDQMIDVNGQGLGRIMDAVRKISKDDLGKEALAESLKTVAIKNHDESAQKSIVLADGVLTLSCAWGTSLSNIFNDADIKTYITENL